MKEIDVREQPILSFSRIAHIAVTGVKYRLFRAIVTVAVIAVAMAFLMNILGESLIKKSVATFAREEIEEIHRTDKWIAKLSIPQSYTELIAVLASPEAFKQDETLFTTGISPEKQEKVKKYAQQAAEYLTFFDELNYGRRRVLVGNASSTGIFDILQDDEAQESLFSALESKNQRGAVNTIQKALNNRPMLTAMQDADEEFGEVIRDAGFDLPEDEAVSLVDQSERVDDNVVIEDTINRPAIRRAVAAKFDVLPGDVSINMIWAMIEGQKGADWYLVTMKENGMPLSDRFTVARLTELAQARKMAKLLIKTELMTSETGGGFMGIGKRMTWLALVSMLVCVVGIANAMLMSVTERFREIATLKCLGALDGFIMTVFLIEASILGLVGGLVGTLIGVILCLLRMSIFFRSLVWQSLPGAQLLIAAVLSVIIGVILAGVAAVYPSFRAARLAPMEAMRIE